MGETPAIEHGQPLPFKNLEFITKRIQLKYTITYHFTPETYIIIDIQKIFLKPFRKELERGKFATWLEKCIQIWSNEANLNLKAVASLRSGTVSVKGLVIDLENGTDLSVEDYVLNSFKYSLRYYLSVLTRDPNITQVQIAIISAILKELEY